MTDIGHNKPPQMLELAKETTKQISIWFNGNNKVTNEDQARQIKLQIDRAKLCLKDLEDDRDRHVRPLNERVNEINARHRAVRTPLGDLLDKMLEALDTFIVEETRKREEQAEAARKRAKEAEEAAREAEKIEHEKIEDAILGETDVNIEALTNAADEAFARYEQRSRAALRAEEQTHVKIGGGFGRALSQRSREVLTIDDPIKFMQDIVQICSTNKLPNALESAILTTARAIKRTHGRYPKGISVKIEKYTG